MQVRAELDALPNLVCKLVKDLGDSLSTRILASEKQIESLMAIVTSFVLPSSKVVSKQQPSDVLCSMFDKLAAQYAEMKGDIARHRHYTDATLGRLVILERFATPLPSAHFVPEPDNTEYDFGSDFDDEVGQQVVELVGLKALHLNYRLALVAGRPSGGRI